METDFTTNAQNIPNFSARMETSYHGLSHFFKFPEVAANSVRGSRNVLMKCIFILNWRWIH